MDTLNPLTLPDELHLITDDGLRSLAIAPQTGHQDVALALAVEEDALRLRLLAQDTAVRGLHLRWRQRPPQGALYQADAWGRQEGAQAWKTLCPHEPMPWSFLLHTAGRTDGIGVETNPDSIASWQVDSEGLSLFLDTRNGDTGVVLGGRELALATVRVRRGAPTETPFASARAFSAALVTQPARAADHLFYGGNNWYYAYGIITQESCVEDAQRMGTWCADLPERPYMLIDDGWQVAHCDGRYNSGPWHAGNFRFPDMPGLAEEMKAAGTRPGLWYRPLVNLEGHMERFQIRNGLKPWYSRGGYAMDPTYPEVRQRLQADAARLAGWGYELIKHDFTTVDLLGSWLGTFDGVVQPSSGWHFHDRSLTNAEIVKRLYYEIQDAAEGAFILGCQTFGHLGCGSLDLQRTGGDVDGRGWERTRRMGPNSLAFRQPQHGLFFQCDADCAPITPTLPRALAGQWLDLLAHSGTPLFISADPKALDAENEKAIRTALHVAASRPALAVPLDWMETPTPTQWQCGEATRSYQWLAAMGCAPAGLLSGDPMRLLHGI